VDNHKTSSFGDRFRMTLVIAMTSCLPIETRKAIVMTLLNRTLIEHMIEMVFAEAVYNKGHNGQSSTWCGW
jgi:hypothetical protein